VCGVVTAGELNRGGGGGNTVIQMTVFCSAAAFYHAAFSKFFYLHIVFLHLLRYCLYETKPKIKIFAWL